MNDEVRPRHNALARALSTIAAFAIGISGVVPIALAQVAPAVADEEPAFSVLVFSKTGGFRHTEAIDAANARITALAAENNFVATFTEDAAQFTEANLANFDAVVFNSTTGDVLNAAQQTAFEDYIGSGGGFAGLHSATDTEYTWPWYGGLVGAYFASHPSGTPSGRIKVEDHVNESTKHLPDTWTRNDEWYNFTPSSIKSNDLHVLLSLDETSYTGGTNGVEHPIAWCQDYEGGRSWYSGLGHTGATYSDPMYVEHLLGGLKIAAGAVTNQCTGKQSKYYEKVTLDANTSSPMALRVAPNGDVFYIERDGQVRIINQETSTTSVALTLPVTTSNEDGLLGIALDPGFETNHWVYLYWSPTNVGSVGPHNKISRFTYDPSSKEINIASQKDLLVVNTQRNLCCHAGGDMIFDNAGNLLLATGDNTNPFDSAGYTPIDERAGRAAYDAQGTSANTNDLRGKVLRITPTPAGGYTVPTGNLFNEADDTTSKTRPEIYAMGFRNPFRMDIDRETGNLMVADYGPDASTPTANRGQEGRVEWNLITQPGNYGWPYSHGGSTYFDWDFASGATKGSKFNNAAPVNDSPNNTGLATLPPVIDPTLWYGNQSNPTYDAAKPSFREIGGGGAPMAGPVYRYDPELESDVKWPEYWDNKALFAEWNNGTQWAIQLDKATSSSVVDINKMLPQIFDGPNGTWKRSMDFEFGPDGALYVIDWGSGFSGNSADSGVYKINYTAGNPSPIAVVNADVTNGDGPLTVNFDSDGTRHPLFKPIVSYSWNFDDGSPLGSGESLSHTFTEPGAYDVVLEVRDQDDNVGRASVRIVVGNTAPTVEITFPDSGGFFEFGDQVRYEVEVTDPDGEVDCENVKVATSLGHAAHGHPSLDYFGCEGVVLTTRDEGHGDDQKLFWILDVTYVDDGGEAGVPLTATTQARLWPKRLQSEFFASTGRAESITGGSGSAGVQTETTSDPLGGALNLSFVEGGDWWSHEPVSLYGVDSIALRAANPDGTPVQVSVRLNAPEGPDAIEVGQITVPNTGGWQSYGNFSTTVPIDKQVNADGIYFVLLNGRMNVNWSDFVGKAFTDNQRPTLTLSAPSLNGTAPFTVTASAAAVDPEGTAITYTWDEGKGDGLQAGTSTREVTYDRAGIYRLLVRATDADGAYNEKYVTVNVVTALRSFCLTGKSDGFTGTSLDTSRWTTVVRPGSGGAALSVADGSLVLPIRSTDLHTTTNTAQNLVLQALPSGGWEAVTKVTVPIAYRYQQAGLILYGDDNNFVKFVVQGRSGTENRDARVIQLTSETNAAAVETNTANLGSAFPDTVYLRLRSDGTTLSAAYSVDNVNYTAVNPAVALTQTRFGTTGKIGVLAMGGTQLPAGAPLIDAKFDLFSLTPNETGPATNDEFDDDSLDGCQWQVVRENSTTAHVDAGALRIQSTPTEFLGAANSATNIATQALPSSGDWTVQTRVNVSDFDRANQQAGLVLYGDDDNFVRLSAGTVNSAGSSEVEQVQFIREAAGVSGASDQLRTANAHVTGTYWLRLSKAGSVYRAQYSADGHEWIDVADGPLSSFTHNFTGVTPRVGLFAVGGPDQGSENRTAVFDHFRLVELDVAATLVDGNAVDALPVAPNESGWVTGAAWARISGDGARGTLYRYYNIDGGESGAMSEYTTPFEVPQGEHTIYYKASDDSGSTPTKSLSVKHDSVLPTADGEVNVVDGERVLTGFEFDDATPGSGLALSQYRFNGGPAGEWTDVDGETSIPVPFDVATVELRAVDVAGNEASVSLVVPPFVNEAPEIDLSADPAVDGEAGWHLNGPVSVDVTVSDDHTDAGDIDVEFSTTNGAEWSASAPSVEADGEVTIQVRATDEHGASATESLLVKLDETKPEVEGVVTVSGQTRQLAVTASDATSGVAALEYRLDGAGDWIAYDAPTALASDVAAVDVRALDNAGNTAEQDVTMPDIDNEAPTLEFSISPASPDGSDGWYRSEVVITTEVTDDAPGAVAEFSVDGGATWSASAGEVTVSTQGTTQISLRAVDALGLESEVSELDEIKLDSNAPVSSANLDADARRVTVRSADATSGVALVEVKLGDDEWVPYEDALDIGDDAVTIAFRATDRAGNTEPAGRLEVPRAGVPIVDTLTAALVSSSERVYGRTGTISVRVTARDDIPTGKVQLMAGSVSLGTATLNSSGRATLSIPSKSVLPGNRTYTVRYLGAEGFGTSNDVVTQKVLKASTTTSVKLSMSTIKKGTRPFAYVTVKSTPSVPVTGKVELKEGSKVLATGYVTNGKVTLKVPALKKGSHYLSVFYRGSGTLTSSKVGVKLTVK